MKKLISFVLALVMLFSLAVPAFAQTKAETEKYDGYPLVVVRGIDFGGLYLEDKSPAISFQLSDVFTLLKNYFTELIINKNEDAFLDSAMMLAADIFEPISMDKDGNSVHQLYFDKYEKSMDNYADEILMFGDVGEEGIIKTAVDFIGSENVYYFTYDWRKSAKEIAGDLNSYIGNILADKDSDKVNIIAVSMGGMVTTSYLYHHGAEKVNNLVYVSSAHNGTYGPGDAFNGDIYIDGNVIFNRINKSFSGGLISRLFLNLIKKIGVFDAVTAVVNKVIEDNPQALNNDTLRNGFGTLLGLWAMCPDDKFESGTEFLFGGYEEEYPVLTDKLDETKEFLFATEETIDSAIANGVNVSFVSNYNTPLAPYYKHSYLQGDGVLETKFTSNFATVADYGETLTDEQLSSANKDYVSPDGVIDATTAIYRDVTWFVKDAEHVAARYGSEYADFVMWLVLSESQPTVSSSPMYPQFMSVDSERNLMAAE